MYQKAMDSLPKHSLMSLRVGFCVLYACIGFLPVFYPLYLKEHGLQPAEIGIVLSFLPLGGVVAGLSNHFLIRRLKGEMNVMCSCLSFLLVSSLCMVFIPLPEKSDVCVEVTLQNRSQTSTSLTASKRTFSLVHKGNEMEEFVYMIGFSLVAFCMQFSTVTSDSIHTAVTLQSLGEANSGNIGNIRAWGSLGHGIG